MTLEKGKRRMRGVFDAEGPLAPALLAFAPYDDRLFTYREQVWATIGYQFYSQRVNVEHMVWRVTWCSKQYSRRLHPTDPDKPGCSWKLRMRCMRWS